jgi:WD40 repeat protein
VHNLLRRDYDGTVRVWQAESGRRRGSPLIGPRVMGVDIASVTCLAVGEVGGIAVIASGGPDQRIHVWDPRSARRLATLQPGGAVNDVALGSRGELVIATGAGLLVVDLFSPKPSDEASGPGRPDPRETWAQTLAHLSRPETI